MAGRERRSFRGARIDEDFVHVDRPNLHAVQRQRAGLVGADHRCAAKRLDAGQVTHQRVSLPHAASGQGHCQRHRWQQSFRHVRDDDADGKDDTDGYGQADESANHEHDQADGDRQRRDHTAQSRDLVLQRRRRIGRRLCQMGDPPESGVHPRREYQRLCLTGRHGRAGQQYVPARQRVRLDRGSSVSRQGSRFAGERGVVDANAKSFDQPAIRGHVIPRTQKDDVAGDDVPGRKLDGRPVPQRPHLVWEQALQRGHRLFGAVLLPEREGAVDRYHRNDRSREHRHALARHPPVRDQRQERGNPQQGREEVSELPEKANHQRGSCQALDAVRPELEPSCRGVCL